MSIYLFSPYLLVVLAIKIITKYLIKLTNIVSVDNLSNMLQLTVKQNREGQRVQKE